MPAPPAPKPIPSDKPPNVWRVALLLLAGIAGSVSLLVIYCWLEGRADLLAYPRHDHYVGQFLRFVALSLGLGVGLRLAGPRLGINGRFWPAFGLSLGVGLTLLLLYDLSVHPGDWYENLLPALLFISIPAAGLAGFLLSRKRARPAGPSATPPSGLHQRPHHSRKRQA